MNEATRAKRPSHRVRGGFALQVVRAVRVDNIRRLVRMHGSEAALARAAGYTQAYINQIAGPNPRRSIGEASARELEVRLRLESGWLDMQR